MPQLPITLDIGHRDGLLYLAVEPAGEGLSISYNTQDQMGVLENIAHCYDKVYAQAACEMWLLGKREGWV